MVTPYYAAPRTRPAFATFAPSIQFREPGIYRPAIFDRLVEPGDHARLADYGTSAEYADRVLGVFQTAISTPRAPGPEEVAETFVRLTETPAGERSFRTIVSRPIEQLLSGYNAAADALRPIVAQIFNVPELADGDSGFARSGRSQL